MIEKIGHYSLENPASIYDEEALTALELAGRTAHKVNECIEQVNENTEKLPGMVQDDVQKHIDNGVFDNQIDRYAGELKKQIADSETEMNNEIESAESRMNSQYNNLENSLGSRLDNLLGQVTPGSTTMDAEVIDARNMFNGSTKESVGSATREQFRLANALNTGCLYTGNTTPITFIKNSDGSATVHCPAKLTRFVNGSEGTLNWSDIIGNISNNATYSANTATITVPAYNSLVYKNGDGKLYLRHCKSVGVDEIVLVSNGWSEILGGTLAEEWVYHNQYLESAHRAQICYHTWTPRHKFIPRYVHTDGETYLRVSVDTYFTAKKVAKVGDNTVKLEFTEERISAIANYYFVDEGEWHNILIPPYYTFVYNYADDKFYMRRYKQDIRPEDIILVNSAWAAPVSGCLVDNYNTYQAYRFDTFMSSPDQSAYVPDEETVTAHAGRMLTSPNGESILYFTDPHLTQKFEDWEPLFKTKMAEIKMVYDASPAKHVICGGDWLGSTDTQAEACFRLGFIDGKMRDMFGDAYHPVLGNHDTNYQGVDNTGTSNTGILPRGIVNNLWYSGNTAYYDFTTKLTRFFVFDTQTDWENTLTDYFIEQLEWFIGQLKGNTMAENLAIALHILHVTTSESGTLNVLADSVTAIAHAFNTRTTYTLNGKTHSFSGCKGKVRFMLAGHTHKDWTGVVNNIPCLITTNVREGSNATFDLLYTDYTHGKLYADRIGTGDSREITI